MKPQLNKYTNSSANLKLMISWSMQRKNRIRRMCKFLSLKLRNWNNLEIEDSIWRNFWKLNLENRGKWPDSMDNFSPSWPSRTINSCLLGRKMMSTRRWSLRRRIGKMPTKKSYSGWKPTSTPSSPPTSTSTLHWKSHALKIERFRCFWAINLKNCWWSMTK